MTVNTKSSLAVGALLMACALTLGLSQGADGRTEPQCPPGNPNCIPKRQPTPKPTPKPPRPPRPRPPRPPRPRPTPTPAQDAPAIELRYLLHRLTRRSAPQQEEEILPTYQFRPTDRFRFAVNVNQDGYLYLIRQSGQNSNGYLIYPSGTNMRGRLRPGEWLRIPNCGRRTHDCQYVLTADARSEIFTLIFSRRAIPELESRLPVAAAIPPEEILRLRAESIRDVERKQGTLGKRLAFELKNETREDDRIVEQVGIRQVN